jgi:hypothetical protein
LLPEFNESCPVRKFKGENIMKKKITIAAMMVLGLFLTDGTIRAQAKKAAPKTILVCVDHPDKNGDPFENALPYLYVNPEYLAFGDACATVHGATLYAQGVSGGGEIGGTLTTCFDVTCLN